MLLIIHPVLTQTIKKKDTEVGPVDFSNKIMTSHLLSGLVFPTGLISFPAVGVERNKV